MKPFAFALLAGAAFGAPVFLTFQVPNCPGGTVGTAINNSGVVAGICGSNGFLRDAHGRFTIFNVGTATLPTAINATGTVTGFYRVGEPPYQTRGFVRSSVDGTITTFGFGAPPPAVFNTFANGINAHGDVVARQSGGQFQIAFSFPAGGVFGLLANRAVAMAINEIGEIAGNSFTLRLPEGRPQGVVFNAEGDILRIVQPPNAGASFVVDINRAGTVAGVFSTAVPFPQENFGATQGYIETVTGQISVFPLPHSINLPDGNPNFPINKLFFTAQTTELTTQIGGGINAQGAMVIENVYRAPDGTLTNIQLGNCGNVQTYGVNDNGIVVGSCAFPGELNRGFLWRK